MISVPEAKKILEANPLPKRRAEVALQNALGKVLAQEVCALSDVPRFDNSAMDGYAVRADDTRGASPRSLRYLSLVGEVRAGDAPLLRVRNGEAVRIMTGAMVPAGATAVVMREHAQEEGRIVCVETEAATGEHIRRCGEEIHSGDRALEAGTVLGPAALAFLASVGVEHIPVYEPPRVGLLVTGDELAHSFEELKPGQILESNSMALKSALTQAGIEEVEVITAADDKKELSCALTRLLEICDCILISGGISVGNWDFTKEILEHRSVETLFWKVAQKPGKPLFFGRLGEKTIFGLPGNPGSALVCFYEYVWGHLRQAMGFADPQLPRRQAALQNQVRKKAGVTHFLRAALSHSGAHAEVALLEGQESFRLGSFARANCLAVLPEESEIFFKGDLVEVDLLP